MQNYVWLRQGWFCFRVLSRSFLARLQIIAWRNLYKYGLPTSYRASPTQNCINQAVSMNRLFQEASWSIKPGHILLTKSKHIWPMPQLNSIGFWRIAYRISSPFCSTIRSLDSHEQKCRIDCILDETAKDSPKTDIYNLLSMQSKIELLILN